MTHVTCVVTLQYVRSGTALCTRYDRDVWWIVTKRTSLFNPRVVIILFSPRHRQITANQLSNISPAVFYCRYECRYVSYIWWYSGLSINQKRYLKNRLLSTYWVDNDGTGPLISEKGLRSRYKHSRGETFQYSTFWRNKLKSHIRKYIGNAECGTALRYKFPMRFAFCWKTYVNCKIIHYDTELH